MQRVGALCGSVFKQAHTQDKEEGMQEPSPHLNKIMGWFFKWRRTPSQEARPQALIISSSRVYLMARGNESSSSSESDSDDEMPSYEEIVQQNLNYAKVCTSQQKKLKILKNS